MLSTARDWGWLTCAALPWAVMQVHLAAEMVRRSHRRIVGVAATIGLSVLVCALVGTLVLVATVGVVVLSRRELK